MHDADNEILRRQALLQKLRATAAKEEDEKAAIPSLVALAQNPGRIPHYICRRYIMRMMCDRSIQCPLQHPHATPERTWPWDIREHKPPCGFPLCHYAMFNPSGCRYENTAKGCRFLHYYFWPAIEQRTQLQNPDVELHSQQYQALCQQTHEHLNKMWVENQEKIDVENIMRGVCQRAKQAEMNRNMCERECLAANGGKTCTQIMLERLA